MEFITKPEGVKLTPEYEDLALHIETLNRWITSCEYQVQLDLCEDLVNRFLEKRFESKVASGKIAELDFKAAIETLNRAIKDQEKIVTTTKPKSNDNASISS